MEQKPENMELPNVERHENMNGLEILQVGESGPNVPDIVCNFESFSNFTRAEK